MKFPLIFLLVLLLAVPASAQERAPMPAISFQTPGGSATLAGYRGKVVYIDFWASWCGPCLAAQPSMTSLAQRMEGKDVVLLSLSMDAKRKKWKKALRKHAPAGVQGWIGATPPEALNILSIPRYVIVDRKGNIAEMNAKGPAQADEALLKVLAE